MRRSRHDLDRRPSFANSSTLQDHQTVREMPDDGKVMADEENGDTGLAAKIGQKLKDGRLHGDIERRRDLVAK